MAFDASIGDDRRLHGRMPSPAYVFICVHASVCPSVCLYRCLCACLCVCGSLRIARVAGEVSDTPVISITESHNALFHTHNCCSAQAVDVCYSNAADLCVFREAFYPEENCRKWIKTSKRYGALLQLYTLIHLLVTLFSLCSCALSYIYAFFSDKVHIGLANIKEAFKS